MSPYLPSDATSQAFYDWCYGEGIHGGMMLGGDDDIAMYQAKMNAWWHNRWKEECDYGEVTWQPPTVHLSFTYIEVVGGESGLYGSVDVRFPAPVQKVDMTLTVVEPATVDGTAELEKEQ